jgi:hypothetical protein
VDLISIPDAANLVKYTHGNQRDSIPPDVFNRHLSTFLSTAWIFSVRDRIASFEGKPMPPRGDLDPSIQRYIQNSPPVHVIRT